MFVKENIINIISGLPGNVRLVAVSKTHPIEMILEAYRAGQRCFGENKVQELKEKSALLPQDIEWHFIGHLQTNKVKTIIPFVSLIHAVDSLKLLQEINKEAAKINRVIPCLLQFYIASEETKFGLSLDEARQILDSDEFIEMKNVKMAGVMGMASYSDDEGLIRSEFRRLKQIFIQLKEQYFLKDDSFKEISMGMSGDYQLAIKEGSTIVRIGSSIFGERNYL